ncbi:MAG TPA: Ig-like domain-containing protein [Longimicrobiales bacterium]|nr:Ig-like domain-containing protein [Longimicrobiales bacterium]
MIRRVPTGRRPDTAKTWWPLGAVLVAVVLGGCRDGAVDPGPDDGWDAPRVTSVVVVEGGGQKGLEGEILPQPVRVRALDDAGRGVPGAHIRFDVAGGAGTALAPTGITDGSGNAATRWRMGPASASPQRLTVSVEGSAEGPRVVVEATAVPPDQADLVVVHGALGPVKGFVVIRETAAGVGLVQERLSADTVLVVQPQDVAGVDVVVFAPSNRPLRVAPEWTSGADTVHVTLQPPVPVDISFTVRVGVFEEQKRVIEEQLASMEWLWKSGGMGIRLGEIRYQDATGTGADSLIVSQGLCSGRVPGSAVEVTYVSTIDAGRYDGWGCWSGHVFMSLRSRVYPYLLAHELGHTFTLEHTVEGLMYPSSPGSMVRDGETFRAHFHQSSVLNTIFNAQPQSMRRTCTYLQATSPCLRDDYRLGAGPVPLMAARAALHDGPGRRGRPLDGVEQQFVRSPRLSPELRPEPE